VSPLNFGVKKYSAAEHLLNCYATNASENVPESFYSTARGNHTTPNEMLNFAEG